jgi:hypothetical protein
LQHIGDVEEYITEFEYISSQVVRLPGDYYLGYFISGLNPIIRLKARTLDPHPRIQIFKMAHDVETELRGSLVPRGGGRISLHEGKGNKSNETRYGPSRNRETGQTLTLSPTKVCRVVNQSGHSKIKETHLMPTLILAQIQFFQDQTTMTVNEGEKATTTIEG